jgi:KaiC/GvpD/RAD55 family RecA-like ATPase
MKVLDLDIPGLDLVMGGGLRLLERVKGAGECATLLIRGPAGSGKSVLGTQLAASIARKLGTDVAYGCVELLPVELRAQHESVRRPSAKEQVVLLDELDEEDEQPDGSFVRIYSGLLDLGEGAEQAVARLGDAIEDLRVAASQRAGRKVRVLVIDSLSDGYGLGTRAPRVLADAVCKLAAAEGLVVVFIEEQAEGRPSVWGFAVDTVFELRQVGQNIADRSLFALKNRLGPVDTGPHRLEVNPRDGVRVLPRPQAYRRSWSLERLAGHWKTHPRPPKQWGLGELDRVPGIPPFGECVTAILGPQAMMVRNLALMIGHQSSGAGPREGPTIFYRFGRGRLGQHKRLEGDDPGFQTFEWGFLDGGAELLSHLRDVLEQQQANHQVPHRIVMGDLRALQHHASDRGMFQSISTAVALLSELRIPTILFQTTSDVYDPESVEALALADVGIICEPQPDMPSNMSLRVMVPHGPVRSMVANLESMGPARDEG